MSLRSDFTHLHVHTQYSLLDGACRVENLLDLAARNGMSACAMTDHGNIFGAVEFYKQARGRGIKPIIGAEIYVAPDSRFDKTSHGIKGAGFHLVLLAKNEIGYNNLMEIISTGYLEGFYYKPRVDKEILNKYSKGLIALSACLKGEVAHYLLSDQKKEARKAATEYADIFGRENFYLEIQDNRLAGQDKINKEMAALSKELGFEIVSTNDVHYLEKTDAKAHDALLCIQTQTTLDDPNRMRFGTDQLYFKSAEEMREAFGQIPEAVSNTLRIAEQCDVKFSFNQIHLPHFEPPEGKDNETFFNELVWEGARKKYGKTTKEIEDRVAYEIDVIKKLGYVSYFLIVQDFINKARELGIPVGPGRGSAAGSIVSYAMGITDLDPLKYGLIFERFLNPARVTMPDIDIDFCYERRNEIIDYVISKYSKDNVAQIITFGTMKAKAVVRDVGRVMGLAYAEVDKIAKLIPNNINITLEEALRIEPELKAVYEKDGTIRELIDISKRLEGLSRHASVHAAGVVISDKPLRKRLPLYKAADSGQVTTGYPMDSLTDIGMLKIDFLGLKTLTVIDETSKIAKRTKSADIDIERVPLDDEKTFELLAKSETVGVFQLESGGMRDLLRKIRPRRFEDIIAVLALYRPGPLGSGMVEEYIKRKNGEFDIKYDHPVLESILMETYGVIIYQEQVMQIVSELAGFSMADADNIRKVMSKKEPEAMAELREKFFQGTDAKGVERRAAERIFDQIEFFAGYGFNKSHSTGYAAISYRTAYLKANFPVEFMAALLTSEKNDIDKIADYIGESLRMGIEILPPDINESYRDFTVVEEGIRFGLVAVKNVGEGAVDYILQTRRDKGRFKSLQDFAEKADSRILNRKVIESLIKCGAFDSTGIFRSQAMAVLDDVLSVASKVHEDRESGQFSFFDGVAAPALLGGGYHQLPDIPEWPEHELLASEKAMLGFYISKHPLARHEKLLNAYSTCGISELRTLADGQRVLIGGLVSKARITMTRKKGEKMAILRLEGLDNFVEVLVFPRSYQKCSERVKEDLLVYVDGRLNLREEEPRIVAEDIIPLEKVKEMFTRSVVVKLASPGLEAKVMQKARSIMKNHGGKTPVFVDLISPDGRKVRLSIGRDLAVSPTDGLLKDMEELVGVGNVKFITKQSA